MNEHWTERLERVRDAALARGDMETAAAIELISIGMSPKHNCFVDGPEHCPCRELCGECDRVADESKR